MFIQNIHNCISAAVPCIAIRTTETKDVIKEITEWAARSSHSMRVNDGKPSRVFVWRESIGFEEWAVYGENSGGEKVRVQKITGDDFRNLKVEKTNVVHAPQNAQIGATIPFAVEFMTNYNTREEGSSAVFILRDWHRYIGTADSNGDHVDRQLSLFEGIVEAKTHHGKTVIMLSPNRWNGDAIPIELRQLVYQTEFDLPDRNDRREMVENFYTSLTHSNMGVSECDEAYRDDLSDALGGLTRTQCEHVLCLSFVSTGGLDINYCLTEKRKLVQQEGFNMSRPINGFEVIGGLTPLKTWISRLKKRFTKAAEDAGFIKKPSGLLMAGVPGCGKSAIAKAMANEWNMNLLTVQATDLKGSLVGESEAKVHRLLDTAKAAAPIIIFVDEAEKLLGKSEGVHDGGAHDAVLGQFLSFMQEDDSGVFFVFTANNMEKFAPELVDRFEGRFFIDLPTASERRSILEIHLGMRKQDLERFDLRALSAKTDNFSGRNIEQGIDEAMTIAFDEDRLMVDDDLLAVFDKMVPTSETKADEIATMRRYVTDGQMVRANDPESLTMDDDVDDNNGGFTTIRNFTS